MRSGLDVSGMDTSVRAQDDLFGRMNGGWVTGTAIPDDKGRYGTFDVLRDEAQTHVRAVVEQAREAVADGESEDAADETEAVRAKVGALYASFLDEERVDALGSGPIEPVFDRIDEADDTESLWRLMGELMRSGVGGALGAYVDTDKRASDSYIVYLVQSGLGLPDESYYREEQYAHVREAYLAHVEKMLALAGQDDAAGAAKRIVALETRLASAHWDRVATRDAVKTYTKVDRAGLRDLGPQIPWDAWAQGLHAPSGAFDEVVVAMPSYVQGLSEAVADVPHADWQAWLAWRVLGASAAYLSAPFVDESFDFYGRLLSGTPKIRERWRRGISLVDLLIGEGAGRLYVEKHFSPAAKERMVTLVDNLVEAYRRDISQLEWMSPTTRAKALEKLDRFTPKIGYPDRWRDYGALEFDAADLLGNVQRGFAFETDRDWAKLGGPVDRDEWFMSPQTVNAYYNPGMNEIVFPAAILQPPFFDADADDAVNYGAIGSVIGHEIGHGFDDQGSRYDGLGNLQDWWTDEDRTRFDELAHALVEQYSHLSSRDLPDGKVNGALTVGENIGDLGGVTIAHLAYRIALGDDAAPELDGYSGDQRFFLGWAQAWRGKARPEEARRLLAIDPHSPMDLRANIVRNLVEFYDAFGVVEGDALWLPEGERVRIW